MHIKPREARSMPNQPRPHSPRPTSFTIPPMRDEQQDLRAHLNAETGKLEWAEVERHFARGAVVKVDSTLDLVEVATCMARDDAEAIRGWMANGTLARATEDDARAWSKRRPLFWAVVAAPWVLVQEVGGSGSQGHAD